MDPISNIEHDTEYVTEIVSQPTLYNQFKNESVIESKFEIELNLDLETESETELNLGLNSESETDSEFETDSEIETQSETETETETETESESESESDSDSDSDSDSESETESVTIPELTFYPKGRYVSSKITEDICDIYTSDYDTPTRQLILKNKYKFHPSDHLGLYPIHHIAKEFPYKESDIDYLIDHENMKINTEPISKSDPCHIDDYIDVQHLATNSLINYLNYRRQKACEKIIHLEKEIELLKNNINPTCK
jgi:hypothetical protein